MREIPNDPADRRAILDEMLRRLALYAPATIGTVDVRRIDGRAPAEWLIDEAGSGFADALGWLVEHQATIPGQPPHWTTESLARLVDAVRADVVATRRAAFDAAVPEARKQRLRTLAPRVDSAGWEAIESGELFVTGALRELYAWAPAPTKPLLGLFGPTGIGKTVAGAEWLVAHDLWDRPDDKLPRHPPHPSFIGGEMLTFGELVRTFTSYREHDRFTEAMGARRLVVDEIPREVPVAPPEARRTMFEILDRRMARGFRTVLIANMTLASFERSYARGSTGESDGDDAPLADRIRSQLQVAHLTGASMRRS